MRRIVKESSFQLIVSQQTLQPWCGRLFFLHIRGGNCVWENARDRGSLLLLKIGSRQWLSREHLIALRSVVDENGLYSGDLLQVGRLKALNHVFIGVVGARLVVQLILDELEAGD